MMAEIEVRNFSKTYKDGPTAVNDVSLTVNNGEIFGLIGPDGAGKTTLIRTLATLLVPTKGTLFVKGMDVTRQIADIRAILGYMPQRFSLYQDLSVEQNLNFFADLFDVPVQERTVRLERLYQFSRLGPFKNRKAGALSGGMKQKLALSCALIHTPDILLLDEPTFGVDPVSRQEFWQILHSIQQDGTTILVSTAYMDEANLCDRVALFFDGRLQALDKPQILRESYQYPLYILESNDLRGLVNHLINNENIHSVQLFGDSLHVSFLRDPSESFWNQLRKESGLEQINEKKIDASIEDVFLSLMETDKG
jgi:ABC-2 type transport system ATP-binding protein